MTVKQFRRKVRNIIENDKGFVTFIKGDEFFEHMKDDEIVCSGQDENEVFVLKIIKVN